MNDALYTIASALYWIAGILALMLDVSCDMALPMRKPNCGFFVVACLMWFLAVLQSLRTIHWG